MGFTFGDAKKAAANSTGTDFEPIPAGEYDFEIEKVLIDAYAGSAKIKPCDKLTLQLRLDLPNGSSRKVWDRIYLDSTHGYSMEKLANVVLSTGAKIKENADKYGIADGLTNRVGKCEIYIREYNGKKQNDVRRYITPEQTISEEDLPF